MKKVCLCVIMAFLLCSCSNAKVEEVKQIGSAGVWLSYYELNTLLTGDEFTNEFQKIIQNCKKLNINSLYIHTRAFGETIYKSDYFPTTAPAKEYDYDIFEYIVKECHKAGLLVYAWINPYRISANEDIATLNSESPAYKWLKDDSLENDGNIGFANGIYLNPATNDVRRLVLDEIREVITKYAVDGIHFDDYFYPTQSENFDKDTYSKYKENGKLLIADWRRENVNMLISSVYDLIKYANEDIVFSVSPAASVEHNYKNLYADVTLWIREGWIDEIIPQVYFGFEYPDKEFCFPNLLKVWQDLMQSSPNVMLKIGLGCYKAAPTLEADIPEWENNDDIIARQVKLCDEAPNVTGYVYFSYSSLFGEKSIYKKQLENILEYLKTGES